MKNYLSGFVLASTIALVACGANNERDVDKSIMPANSNSSNTQAAAPAANQARTMPPAPAINATPTATTTGSIAQGTNPPHGQPGHRCDIAVGAPLNSAPAANAPAVKQAVAAPTNVPANAPAINMPAPAPVTTTAPGMNPPHGQPGHDCAIPVGAPLKKG